MTSYATPDSYTVSQRTFSLESKFPSLSVFVTVREPSGFRTDFVVMPVVLSVELAEAGALPKVSVERTFPFLSVLVTVREPSGFRTDFVVMPVVLSVELAEAGALPKVSVERTFPFLSVLVTVREPLGFRIDVVVIPVFVSVDRAKFEVFSAGFPFPSIRLVTQSIAPTNPPSDLQSLSGLASTIGKTESGFSLIFLYCRYSDFACALEM